MTSDKNAPYWEQDIAECLRVAAEIIGPNSYYLRAAEYIDELRAECERLNKELQAASIDYRGCMLDRAEYLRRMREAEAECERLGRLVYSLSWQRKDFRERWLHNLERATRLHSERAVMENRVFSAEAREREAYERAAKVASEKISEYSGNDACAVYVANILRSLAGERREG